MPLWGLFAEAGFFALYVSLDGKLVVGKRGIFCLDLLVGGEGLVVFLLLVVYHTEFHQGAGSDLVVADRKSTRSSRRA